MLFFPLMPPRSVGAYIICNSTHPPPPPRTKNKRGCYIHTTIYYLIPRVLMLGGGAEEKEPNIYFERLRDTTPIY